MIDAERFFAFDTETWTFSPGDQAPPMVCITAADAQSSTLIHRRDPASRSLVDRMTLEALKGDTLLVGQHVAFDFAVICNEWPDLMPRVFDLYDRGKVLDTLLRQKLIDIGSGNHTKGQKYNLGVLAKRHDYPGDIDKENPWRLRYRELDNVPCAEWPKEAREYPLEDVRSTLFAAVSQEDDAQYLEDQNRQARAAFALQLISVWGIRTDRIMVARHRRNVEARLNQWRSTLLNEDLIYQVKGVWKKRAKVAEEMAQEAWLQAGFDEVPRDYQTKGGKASLNEDSMAALDHPLLLAYQGFASASTTMSHIEELELGTTHPLHTRWDTILENGRTSSSGPNLQNREVDPGDRECFVPREGCVFLDGDVKGLELSSVCQVLKHLGIRSFMADAINNNIDPHTLYAATLLGCDYETAKRRCADPNDKEAYLARQTGKINNFGRYGGMGDTALQMQARSKYKRHLTMEDIVEGKIAWHATWPEAKEYFAYIRDITSGGSAWVTHIGSGRIRGDCRYTQAANTLFSGLGADATKAATYALVKECYIGRGPLRGSRVVNYIHDQWLTETEEEGLTEKAEAKRRIVDDAVNEWLPDVKTTCAPFACRRWSKLATRTTDDKGRLIAWEWDEATAEGSPGYAT